MTITKQTASGDALVKDEASARLDELEYEGEQYLVLSYPLSWHWLPNELSEAEAAVVILVMHGLSNAAIAQVRQTSPRTIANQLAAIYRKLGISSRVELAAHVAESRNKSSNAKPRAERVHSEGPTR